MKSYLRCVVPCVVKRGPSTCAVHGTERKLPFQREISNLHFALSMLPKLNRLAFALRFDRSC